MQFNSFSVGTMNGYEINEQELKIIRVKQRMKHKEALKLMQENEKYK